MSSRSARCGVVGLGLIGTTLADAFASAGFAVRGYDRDPEVAERFRSGEGVGRVACHDADALLSWADVVVLAVRVFPTSDGGVDVEPLRAAAADLLHHASRERLVLLTSTVPPGTTRQLAEQWLGGNPRCLVAHSPERLAEGQDHRALRGIPQLVGGVDAAAGRVASELFRCVCDEVHAVSAPEVSELSKLLENAFRAVGIGLVTEVTRAAHAHGVSANEVCEAAASKPFGYHPFFAGAGIGGHCIPNDLAILRHACEAVGWHAPLLAASAEVIARAPTLLVDLVARHLGDAGRSLDGARVLLVGVGFKVGSADTTASPARDVARILRERGAQPLYLDSRVRELVVDGEPLPRVEAPQLAREHLDAAIVLAGDPALDAADLDAVTPLVIDAGGAAVLRGRLLGANRI